MSQYLLINKIKVQNANAIAGFTWGFPAITHFLGFTHNLSRKLEKSVFNIDLLGCAVISHKNNVHTYGNYEKQFTQLKTCAYLEGDAAKTKKNSLSIIEEGKMNMTVSLLIPYEGRIGGNKKEHFLKFIQKNSYLQRLAGGTILEIEDIQTYNLDPEIQEAKTNLHVIKRKCLPGFLLQDRSHYLKQHYEALQKNNSDIELLDAWLDFVYLKQKARPKSDLINKHIEKAFKSNSIKESLKDAWEGHIESHYDANLIPNALKNYFLTLENNKANKALLNQWQEYCSPSDKTDADWAYVAKPNKGYLVPIMTGYKAISKVYNNDEVENTRDNESKVCFVESTHSVGEWQSVHRIKNVESLNSSVWKYCYEKDWYQSKQNKVNKP